MCAIPCEFFCCLNRLNPENDLRSHMVHTWNVTFIYMFFVFFSFSYLLTLKVTTVFFVNKVLYKIAGFSIRTALSATYVFMVIYLSDRGPFSELYLINDRFYHGYLLTSGSVADL